MQARSPVSRNIPRYCVLSGLVVIGCGMAVAELCGQHPVHDRAPPPNVLNYPCLPKRETWGFYAPKWRRWPGVPAVGAPAAEELDTDLPGVEAPTPEQEDVRVPTPVTPATPLEAAPSPAGEGPGAVAPGAAPQGPFAPTPAAPVPGGGVPGLEGGASGLRSAPLPTTPLPGGQLPDDAAPLPGGVTPQPAPGRTPDPLNPFDGAEADASGFGDDPPPSLPPSLRTSRRMRDAKRAAAGSGSQGALTAGVTRLPGTAAPGQSPGRYAVQQTSATVWASGTDDIRPTDPNAGRVQQAIHHEPAK